MPLSDDDQQRLDAIEQSLTKDDPEFAARVSLQWRQRRRLVGAIAIFVVGAVLLVAGLVTTYALLVVGVVIAVVGTAAMATAGAMLLRRPRR